MTADRQPANAGISRKKHSDLLRRKSTRGSAPDEEIGSAPSPETTLAETGPEETRAVPAAGARDGRMRATTMKHGVLVEQALSHYPGKGRPALQCRLRLTTAARGQRKTDGLTETAYVMRLEVESVEGAFAIRGFTLGPWRADGLKLETGSLFLAAPLWSAFQPRHAALRGRLLVADVSRNQVFDLPWDTEAWLPGDTPFPG